jgi:hypothetical protein
MAAGEMSSTVSPGSSEGRFPGGLRVAALVALLAGAVGSFGLMLHSGRNAPRLLIVIFTIWVLSPFVVLGWADVVSKRKHWSVLTRAALHGVMLVVALGSLAIYGADAVWPRKAQAAFVYVIVSPASWLLTAAVVPMAAWISRRRSALR